MYTCKECGHSQTCPTCRKWKSEMARIRTSMVKTRAKHVSRVKAKNRAMYPVVRGGRMAREIARRKARKAGQIRDLRIIREDDARFALRDMATRGHVSEGTRDMSPRADMGGHFFIMPPRESRVTERPRLNYRFRMERVVHEDFNVRVVRAENGAKALAIGRGQVLLKHVIARALKDAGLGPKRLSKSQRNRRMKQNRNRLMNGVRTYEAAEMLSPEGALAILEDRNKRGFHDVKGCTCDQHTTRGKCAPVHIVTPQMPSDILHMPELEQFVCVGCGLEWSLTRNAGEDVCMDCAGIETLESSMPVDTSVTYNHREYFAYRMPFSEWYAIDRDGTIIRDGDGNILGRTVRKGRFFLVKIQGHYKLATDDNASAVQELFKLLGR